MTTGRVYSRALCTGPPAKGDAFLLQVLAATQTPTDKEWFQGTADAVRQYTWLFEDIKNRVVQDIIILSGDHLCAARPPGCPAPPALALRAHSAHSALLLAGRAL